MALKCRPEAFAIYTLIWSVLQLSAGIQNAVVSTPMLAARATEDVKERESIFSLLIVLSSGISLVLALSSFIVVVLLKGSLLHGSDLLPMACSLSVLGLWSREVRRAVGYIKEEPKKVLLGDVVFVCLAVLLGFGLFRLNGTLSPAIVLGATGLAGVATGTFVLPLTRTGIQRTFHQWRAARTTILAQIGWTLPSVAMSWVQAYAYSFLALSLGGLKSVAALNFARLTTTPATLVQGAWARLFQPRAAKMMADGNSRGVPSRALLGVWTMGLITLLYGGILVVVAKVGILPQVSSRLDSVLGLIQLWVIYLIASGVRGPATSLLVAAGRFRHLFLYGAIATAMTVTFCWALGKLAGPGGIVGGMIAGELILGALAWSGVRRFYAHYISSPGA